MVKHRSAAKLTHPHASVPHPADFLVQTSNRFVAVNDRILSFFSDHVLASMLMFDVALVVPLLAIRAPDQVKLTLALVSGSWIQWWALHALQRSQVKADQKRTAKADADHMALTHVAMTLDHLMAKLESMEAGGPKPG